MTIAAFLGCYTTVHQRPMTESLTNKRFSLSSGWLVIQTFHLVQVVGTNVDAAKYETSTNVDEDGVTSHVEEETDQKEVTHDFECSDSSLSADDGWIDRDGSFREGTGGVPEAETSERNTLHVQDTEVEEAGIFKGCHFHVQKVNGEKSEADRKNTPLSLATVTVVEQDGSNRDVVENTGSQTKEGTCIGDDIVVFVFDVVSGDGVTTTSHLHQGTKKCHFLKETLLEGPFTQSFYEEEVDNVDHRQRKQEDVTHELVHEPFHRPIWEVNLAKEICDNHFKLQFCFS